MQTGRVPGCGGLLVLVAIIVFSMFVAWTQRADAHDWYPIECCSDKDCRPVSASAIRTGPQGYVINSSGETVGYRDSRVRTSPDDDYHWCNAGGMEKGRTICLFVPQQMY